MADTQYIQGLDGVLDMLKSLPPEIVSKRGGPVKSALRKGAVVVQRAAQAQVRRVVTDTAAQGYVSTRTLEDALVVRRDPNPQRSGANERYRVLIKRGQKYATLKNGKPATAVMTGRWLEYGTEHQPAEPWMLPAFLGSRQQALNTVVEELNKGVQLAIRKVSKGR